MSKNIRTNYSFMSLPHVFGSLPSIVYAVALSASTSLLAKSGDIKAPQLEVTDHSSSTIISGMSAPLGTWSILNAKPARIHQVSQIAAGPTHSLVIKSDGSVVGWGYGISGQTTAPIDLGPVSYVASGGLFSIALTPSSTLRGWGSSYQGKTPPPMISNVVSTSAGHSHALALNRDGTVTAWGSNVEGQCSVPSGLANVIAVAAGGKHSLALKADGTIVAWGDNRTGQCDIPSDAVNVVAIAAGQWHSAALLANGSVQYWKNYVRSSSTNGLLGPSELRDVIAISAGGYSVMALRRGGSVIGWGNNEGNVPTNLAPAISVSAGYVRAMALHADGSITNWGNTDWYADLPAKRQELETPVGGPDQSYAHLGYLENKGTAVLTDVRAVIEGEDADQFSILLTQVTNVALGGKSAFAIRFNPTRGGLLRAELKVYSNAPNSPFVLPLRGFGNFKMTAAYADTANHDFSYGPLRLDRQTGLLLQQIQFINRIGVDLYGLRLSLSKLATGIHVFSSSLSEKPDTLEVLYSKTIAVGEKVVFDLIYYDPMRRKADAILPVISAEAIVEPILASLPVLGRVVPITRIRITQQGPLLSWTSKPKSIYVVEYSDNEGITWQSAIHLLQAGANRMSWVDRGQPETRTKPGLNVGNLSTSRQYRIKLR